MEIQLRGKRKRMKKIIASLVSISILAISSVPAPAQVPQKIVRGVKAFTSTGTQKAVTPRLTYPTVSVPAARVPANALAAPQTKYIPSAPAGIPSEQTLQNIRLGVDQAAVKAQLGENLNLAQIRERIAQGNYAGLAARILNYPNPAVREGMLRNEFVQVALAGRATAAQTERAADFWRSDLQSGLEVFSSLPQGDLAALSNAYQQKHASVLAANEALADVAALGIYGTKKDAPLILDFYRKAASTPLEPLAAAACSRALLRLGAQTELAALAQQASTQPALWQNISSYAQKQGFSIEPAVKAAEEIKTEAFRPALKQFGKINLLAADPSKEATAVYMNLGRTAAVQAEAPAAPAAERKAGLPAAELELPALDLSYNPAELQIANLSISGGENTAQSASASSLTGFQQAVRQAQTAKKSSIQFFARNEKPAAAGNAGTLYGGVPLPAMWQSAKKAFSAVKKFFTPKTPSAAERPELAPAQQQPASGLTGALQRASLYLASFVMGLEVATPVIANFGTSFGLSLSDNILVAVATYLPYSVGAFLSNWLKEKIGRKASMNIGLALMGGGFTAGVTLFGLNGHFVPDADTLQHFYNILGCITLASTGGVFVHNAVGPMMTDLSAGASELSLQKRNANTEFSRALGMAASFAFPFISTKLLGMDWSFTFALPIPLVAAAALGINLSRIPNTKPVLEPKTEPAPVPVAGQRNRRAYQLTSSFLNNSYVRLFKEEKGVLALLTGLMAMNAVEMSYSNGFLFLLPGLTTDPSSQYLFGLMQFAAPFLVGRYLARSFLKWFPKSNMTIATLISALGGLAALPLSHNVYALTAALFAAEVGISTTFTLAFARSARNIRTQDRIVSLIVASAISCAFGPMLLTNLAEKLMAMGVFESAGATTAAMIGVPAVLSVLSAMLFKRIERFQAPAQDVAENAAKAAAAKPNWFKKWLNKLFGKNNKPQENM